MLSVDKVWEAVSKQHEEYSSYISNYESTELGYFSKIDFNYKFGKNDLKSMHSYTNRQGDAIIKSIIKPGMTQLNKIKAIHDYIIKNTKYDHYNFMKNSIPDVSYTAYGVLHNHIAVCEGYTAAFNLLCEKAGIAALSVNGDANGPHAWNAFIINGQIRYVDVTWDDPVSNRDILRYDYFNIDQNKMARDHFWKLFEYDKKYFGY